MNESREFYFVCSNFLTASKLIGDCKKQRFIDANGFASIDDLNEWIKRCETDFIELIEQFRIAGNIDVS